MVEHGNSLTRSFIAFRVAVFLSFLGLVSCTVNSVYIPVKGADVNRPEDVAFVVNMKISERFNMMLYAVDGERVEMEVWDQEYYAITPGRHSLWILSTMALGGPFSIPIVSNRCFTFDVELKAGKTYFLVQRKKGKQSWLVTNGEAAEEIQGRLVDESWWTCHWD